MTAPTIRIRYVTAVWEESFYEMPKPDNWDELEGYEQRALVDEFTSRNEPYLTQGLGTVSSLDTETYIEGLDE